MKKFNPTRAIIPNSFTAMNLASGFFSILFSSQGNFDFAIYLIFLAAFFDVTDGAVARLFRTSSKFGVELDSLADVVSFGAAPSALFYFAFSFQFDNWGIIASVIFLLFGAFRLARFNTMLENYQTKPDFNGLPIPMAAITFSAFMLWVDPNPIVQHPYDYLAVILFISLSILMVSEVKYFAMSKIAGLNKTTLSIAIFITIFFIVAVIYTKGQALFFYFLLIVLTGFFNKQLKKIIFKNKKSKLKSIKR